ncbi:hypothetical protein CBM2626_B50045 [Cupriavidus taiwanensis]|nr:hypothetical protein CBM2626_B50045 [Cupriavidus taiwanensis]
MLRASAPCYFCFLRFVICLARARMQMLPRKFTVFPDRWQDFQLRGALDVTPQRSAEVPALFDTNIHSLCRAGG